MRGRGGDIETADQKRRNRKKSGHKTAQQKNQEGNIKTAEQKYPEGNIEAAERKKYKGGNFKTVEQKK